MVIHMIQTLQTFINAHLGYEISQFDLYIYKWWWYIYGYSPGIKHGLLENGP